MDRKRTKISPNTLNFSLKTGRKAPIKDYDTNEAQDWQENLFSPMRESRFEETKINIWRLVPFFGILIFSLFLLAGKSWHLQAIEGDKNLILSEGNRIRIKTLPGARGKIYDRFQKILARNGPGLKLVVVASEIEDENRIIQILSPLLGESEQEIRSKIDEAKKENAFSGVAIKTNLPHETQLEILARQKELKGVSIEEDIIREYPEGEVFSAVCGYTGEISSDELAKPEFAAYTSGDFIGRAGIEGSYEDELKGKKGRELIEVDAFGKEEEVLARQDPESGNSLILNLDFALQKKAKEYLDEGIKNYGASGGVVIIEKVQTGEILTSISSPSFDNNLFAKGISQAELAKLLEDPAQPLFNRAISGTYPCGSTIKPMVAAAALEEKIITKDTKILDKGAIQIGAYRFPCWTSSWGLAPHGLLNVEEALSQSCDVFFYTIGGGYENQPGLGVAKLKEYALKFGLMAKTGIDLPAETSGFYPDEEWKLKEKGEPWYLGDTYWISIGQSYVLVTPLQLNNYLNAIANGGKLMRPYLVSAIIDENENPMFNYQPEVIRERFIASENLAIVKEGMRKSVSEGIIYPLRNSKVAAAAKTGTAEYGEKDAKGYYETHAWVSGFAPYDNPEITFTVFLEGGGASNNAAEVAKKIIDWYYTEGQNRGS